MNGRNKNFGVSKNVINVMILKICDNFTYLWFQNLNNDL